MTTKKNHGHTAGINKLSRKKASGKKTIMLSICIQSLTLINVLCSGLGVCTEVERCRGVFGERLQLIFFCILQLGLGTKRRFFFYLILLLLPSVLLK